MVIAQICFSEVQVKNDVTDNNNKHFVTAFEGECRNIIELREHLKLCFLIILSLGKQYPHNLPSTYYSMVSTIDKKDSHFNRFQFKNTENYSQTFLIDKLGTAPGKSHDIAPQDF